LKNFLNVEFLFSNSNKLPRSRADEVLNNSNEAELRGIKPLSSAVVGLFDQPPTAL